SLLAEKALTLASKIARQNKARLILLHVASPQLSFVEPVGSYPISDFTLEELKKIPEDYLQNLASSPELKGLMVKTVIESGDAASTICDVAMEEGCDLIVMSTHGRSGLRRWVMGSVTEKVLRHAPTAVFAVQSADMPKHFLLTLDGSVTAELAIEPTLAMAAAFGSKVTFATIQDPRELPDNDLIQALQPVDDSLAERIKTEFYDRAHNYLTRLIPKYQNRGIEIEGITTDAHPADGILNLCETHMCDAIAMCTHGRTGLSRWRYGSVTEKVLRQSQRNMLIIRALQHEKVVSTEVATEVIPAT
ncbi:MAG: universal stress protein, partial [Anaerolineales bacterium]|nr:universal stress protein [Anaerolineales bacterium]